MLCHPSGNAGGVPGLQLTFCLDILGQTEEGEPGGAVGRALGSAFTRTLHQEFTVLQQEELSDF